MKKKIILLAAALMLIATGVSASSLNGDYKGNPIVKITSNGKALELDEVPPMIFDGHTVVPISLLRQLGASVTWDQASYSVDVKLPTNELPTTGGVTKVLILKRNAELASLYKLAQDVSNRMIGYNETISNYFSERSQKLNTHITDQNLYDKVEWAVNHYNDLSNRYSANKNKFTYSETNDLSTSISKLYDSLEKYKQATKDIIDWNYYGQTTPRGQESFNNWIINRKDYFKLSDEAWALSKDGYEKYISKVINE